MLIKTAAAAFPLRRPRQNRSLPPPHRAPLLRCSIAMAAAQPHPLPNTIDSLAQLMEARLGA